MSPDAWGALAACAMTLTALLGFVWNAAKTATQHDMRLTGLERNGTKTEEAIDRLTDAVTRLDKHLYAAEKVARASVGQFDEGSERPPKG